MYGLKKDIEVKIPLWEYIFFLRTKYRSYLYETNDAMMLITSPVMEESFKQYKSGGWGKVMKRELERKIIEQHGEEMLKELGIEDDIYEW